MAYRNSIKEISGTDGYQSQQGLSQSEAEKRWRRDGAKNW